MDLLIFQRKRQLPACRGTESSCILKDLVIFSKAHGKELLFQPLKQMIPLLASWKGVCRTVQDTRKLTSFYPQKSGRESLVEARSPNPLDLRYDCCGIQRSSGLRPTSLTSPREVKAGPGCSSHYYCRTNHPKT